MSQPISDEKMLEIISQTIDNYSGDARELESAIGMLVMGRQFGWRVIYLVHGRGTVKKYEKILGTKVRDVMPDDGPYASRSVGWRLLRKVNNFWKAVRGEIEGIRSPILSFEPLSQPYKKGN